MEEGANNDVGNVESGKERYRLMSFTVSYRDSASTITSNVLASHVLSGEYPARRQTRSGENDEGCTTRLSNQVRRRIWRWYLGAFLHRTTKF